MGETTKPNECVTVKCRECSKGVLPDPEHNDRPSHGCKQGAGGTRFAF